MFHMLRVAVFVAIGMSCLIGRTTFAWQDEQRQNEDDVLTIQLRQQQVTTPGQGITQLYVAAEDADQLTIRGENYDFIRPKSLEGKELGYFYVYFVGRKGVIEKGIAVLVDEFQNDRPRFLIDTNNNLDFSDDPDFDAYDSGAQHPVLTLQGDDAGAEFSIRLIPFHSVSELTDAKKNLYAQLFGGNQVRGPALADVDYWFFSQRLNNRTNTVTLGSTELIIGLHDYDCDGGYAGDRDRFVVGEANAEEVSDRLADGAVAAKTDEIFLVGAAPYKIVEVDPAGDFVRIAQSDKMPDRLFVGSELPDVELTMMDGSTRQLHNLMVPDRYLVLEFWGQWCAPCVATIPDVIQFHDRWNHRVQLVGIHEGDHDVARQLIEEKGMEWPHAEFQAGFGEALFIDGWPTYVLVGADGRILDFATTLEEIGKRLESESQEESDR